MFWFRSNVKTQLLILFNARISKRVINCAVLLIVRHANSIADIMTKFKCIPLVRDLSDLVLSDIRVSKSLTNYI